MIRFNQHKIDGKVLYSIKRSYTLEDGKSILKSFYGSSKHEIYLKMMSYEGMLARSSTEQDGVNYNGK